MHEVYFEEKWMTGDDRGSDSDRWLIGGVGGVMGGGGWGGCEGK